MIAKLGVKLETLRPELAILEPLVDEVYEGFDLQAVVTSTNEGAAEVPPYSVHKKGSLHYKDAAFDLRVKPLSADQQKALHQRLKATIAAKYPGYYDVLLEYAGGTRAHVHVEAGPKLVKQMEGA